MTKRYVDCGNEILSLGKYSTHQSDAIVKKHRLSNNFNWTMKKLGYVQNYEQGKYEAKKDIMTFSMADKMIAFIRQYAKDHKSRNSKSYKSSEHRQLTQAEIDFNNRNPFPMPKKVKDALQKKVQQKTFSLFWGLIKFNY
jgi:hypothetical protein